MRDDSELLRHYADSRSEEAFSELVRRHIGFVYAVALRGVGGDSHLAKDVTQEVFTDLARKAAPLARRKTLAGWLFVASRFAASKSVRRDHQQRTLGERAQRMTEHAAHAEAEPAWEELRGVLDDAIHELNERDREAILLHFFDKRTYAELGARLSLTESGARMRVERALNKLRASLGRRGINSTGAALAAALGGQAVAEVPGTLATTVTAAALASAAPSGGAALLIMSITKSQLAAGLAIAVTGAAILGVTLHREITALRAEQASLQGEADASRRRANDLAVKLANDDALVAKLNLQLSRQKDSGATAANPSANGAKILHIKDIIRDHPEYEALMRKDLRRSTLRMYGRAVAALNLAQNQATQLKELLVERELASDDAREAAVQAGLKWDSKNAGKVLSEATKDLNQAITSLIGADGVEKLEGLKATNFYGSVNQVDEYALDMADAGASLSVEQAQTLSQWLREVANPDRNPDAGAPGFNDVDPSTWQSPLDQQFYAKAAAILTPTQLQVLKASRSENNQRQAIIRSYTGNEDLPVMITD
jgi:RNA polymerase sigma factor (sigma-70 family)